jgi:hypothetical protein
MFESESWTHGTSIKAHSGVDYMAVALKAVRSDLNNLGEAGRAMERGDERAYWLAMYAVFGNDRPWPSW